MIINSRLPKMLEPNLAFVILHMRKRFIFYCLYEDDFCDYNILKQYIITLEDPTIKEKYENISTKDLYHQTKQRLTFFLLMTHAWVPPTNEHTPKHTYTKNR